MSDIVFGIKLKYDGKEVDGGVTISRQQLRQFAADAKNAGETANGSFTSAARGVRSISEQLDTARQTLLGYIGASKGIDTARWVLEQASAMQQLDARLKVATASATDFARAQAGVFAVANKYGAAVGETASAFARLNPVIAQMGGGAGTTLKMLDGLSASLRLSGATAAETSAVLLQFSQAMGSGRVGGDEFRSMMENAEPLMRAVAQQMGKTTAELRQMSEEGKLTSSTFGNALLPAIDKLAKQAGQIPLGIDQAWQVLKNNMSRDFGHEFGGQANIVAGAIKGISEHSVELAAAVHAGADALNVLAQVGTVAATGALAATFSKQGKAAWEASTAMLATRAARIADLQATEAQAAANLQSVQATQAAVLAAREKAMAELACANATYRASSAIGAYSTALAASRNAAVSKSAALVELAALGQKQIAVTAELAAAEAAHATAQRASASATLLTAVAGRGAGVVMGALGGPIGIITTLLTVGISAWSMWGESAASAADKSQKAIRKAAEESARTGLSELQILRSNFAQAADAYHEDMSNKKRRDEFVAAQDALQQAEMREKNLAARANDNSAAGRLSAAGEFSKLTADLKYREKLVKDHQEALLKLETSYRDKWGETAAKDRPAFEATHQQALAAMLRQHKKELDSLPEVQDAKDISAARAETTIAAAKANVKRYGDIYKQELEQFRLSTSDYIDAMSALEKQALLTERRAVASEKPVSDADKIRRAGKLQELDAQLADVDKKRQAAIEDAEAKAHEALMRLSVVAGKVLDPLDEAGRQFVKEFGATMQRAAIDGNQALIDMGAAAWQAMANDAQFKTAKDKYDALFADLQLQLEAVRQAAERDGGLLAGLAAAGKSDDIRAKLLPAIAAAQKEMESFAGTSLVNQKSVTETKRQIGKIADEGNETWKKFTAQIETSLTESLNRGFDKGKPASQAFVDGIRNTLKTAGLKVGVQAFVDPVMGGVRGMFSGTGTNASANGSNSLLNNISNGWSIYSGQTSASATSFATSSAGQAIGLSAPLADTTFTAAGSGIPWAAGVADASTLSAAGSALATAAPYLAAAYVIYSLFSGSGGGPKSGGGSGASIVDGRYIDMGRGAVSYTPSGDDASMAKTTSALASDYMRYAAQLGGVAANTKMSLAYDSDPNGSAPNRISGLVTDKNGKDLFVDWNHDVGRDSANLQAQLSLETKKMLLAALQASDLPAAVAAVLQTVDAASATSEQVDKVLSLATTFKTLSQVLPQIAGLDSDSVKSLAKSAGDNFGAQVADFYQNYFTQMQRDLAGMATARSQVNDAFASIGKAVPADEDAFKALANSIDLTTEAGRKEMNTLMQIEGVFHSLAVATTNLLNNAIAAYQGYQAAIGNTGAAMAASSSVAGIGDGKAEDKLAAAFGVDRQTLDAVIAKAGGNLGNIAATYWGQMSDAQKAAIGEAMSARTAYIATVKSQFDAQQQIVTAAYNNVKKLSDFGSTLDDDVARLRIAAGSLDQSAYLDAQIGKQQAALDALYAGGASPDELLATAGKIRDLTLQENDLKISGIKEMMQFSVQVGDYLKGLKVGDLSPLTMGQKLSEAGAQLNDVLLALESGTEAEKTAARAKLTNNADAYLKLAQQYDPSTYGKVFDEVQKALSPYADVGTVAEQQLAQQQAIAARAQGTIEQLQALKAQAGTWQASAQGKLDTAVAGLAPLSIKLDQLGAGGAIELAIRDLPKALADLISRAGTTSTPGTTAAATATKSYPTGSAVTGGLGGSALLASMDGSEGSVITMLTRARAGGMMPADIAAMWNDAHPEAKIATEDLTAWAKQRGIPGFDIGTNSVTEDTLAVIHKRERIMPAADNDRLFEILEGGGNAGIDAGVARLLGSLVQKIDTLITNQERLAAQVAELQARATEVAADKVVSAIESSGRQRANRVQEALL